jgi:hypothetical protein
VVAVGVAVRDAVAVRLGAVVLVEVGTLYTIRRPSAVAVPNNIGTAGCVVAVGLALDAGSSVSVAVAVRVGVGSDTTIKLPLSKRRAAKGSVDGLDALVISLPGVQPPIIKLRLYAAAFPRWTILRQLLLRFAMGAATSAVSDALPTNRL